MLVRRIIKLLPKEFLKSGGWVVTTVPIKAILNLIGVAALLPILTLVLDNSSSESTSGFLTQALKGIPPITICIGVIVIMVVKSVLNIFISLYQNRYMMKIYRYFSTALFSNFYKKGLLYVKDRNSADLAHEINGVCYAFSLGLLSPILVMTGEAILLLLIYVSLIVYSPITSILVPICFIPAVILYICLVKNRLIKAGKMENEAKRKSWKTVLETFRGYSEIEVNGAFPSIEKNFDNNLQQISHQREKISAIQQIPSSLIEISIAICMVILIAISGINDGDTSSVISGMTFGVFAIAAIRMLPAVRALTSGWTTIKNNLYCMDIIESGLKCDSEESECEDFHFESQIQMNGVSFAFPEGERDVLDSFSVTIQKGEKIGVRGASGAGKTTLFNLLLGFYPPTKGNIRIDGKLLTPTNRAGWLKRVGYVPQDVYILDASLAENIALGATKEEIDLNKVLRIIKEVSLDSFYKGLSNGLESRIGEAGSKLSGGQRQRVGIARALYKEADVLFFDEATSALDSETEREINESMLHLSESRKDLTIIAIAHRETSLSFCDRIIEL